jgi:integrase
MSQEKPLQQVPKGVKYLRVFCHGCDTLPGNICRKTGKPIEACEHGEKQRYKIIKYEGKVRKTTTLETRDLSTAIAMLGGASKLTIVEPTIHRPQKVLPIPSPSNTPQTLVDWLARYSGHLKGDKAIKSIYSRDHYYSRKHLLDLARYQKYFILSLKKMGKNVENMNVSEVGEEEIRGFLNYMSALDLAPVSIDKGVRVMSAFMNTIKKMGYDGRNYFSGIPRKAKQKEVETISEEEIKGMLSLMDDPDPKNHIHPNGKSINKSWNKHALLIGALTGRRNEEISELRWDNIVFDANQNPISLQATDFKASRMRGTETSNPKIINIPIIPELKETLLEMGLENFKGSHKYLLAPEENISRVTLKLHLSHMFKFYYDKLETGKHRQYKHLRKFYISKLVNYIGLDNARLVTGHSGVEVMNHHYIDKRTIALSESTKNMTILGSQNDTRSEELKALRKPSNEKSIEL